MPGLVDKFEISVILGIDSRINFKRHGVHLCLLSKMLWQQSRSTLLLLLWGSHVRRTLLLTLVLFF